MTLLVCITLTLVSAECEARDSLTILPSQKIAFPDTIRIQQIGPNSSSESSSMPWIAALIIGLFSAAVNIWAANSLRKSNERNLQNQLENARKMMLAELEATLGTKNRQDWIDTVIHNLSEFVSLILLFNILVDEEQDDDQKIREYIEKIYLVRSKILMLLNEDEPEQKQILEALNAFDKDDPGKFAELLEAVPLKGRALFSIQWKKIRESVNFIHQSIGKA